MSLLVNKNVYFRKLNASERNGLKEWIELGTYWGWSEKEEIRWNRSITKNTITKGQIYDDLEGSKMKRIYQTSIQIHLFDVPSYEISSSYHFPWLYLPVSAISRYFQPTLTYFAFLCYSQLCSGLFPLISRPLSHCLWYYRLIFSMISCYLLRNLTGYTLTLPLNIPYT